MLLRLPGVPIVAVALAVIATPAYAAGQAMVDPVLAAAGDISCPPRSPATEATCDEGATAALIRHAAPSAVAALGDDQYPSGTLSEFTGPGAFGATWGLFKSSIHPVPGNHEYDSTPTASGYFRYFGSAAGVPRRGYYSYKLGTWHLIALNSDCSDSGCGNYESGKVTSAEVRWLRSDLADHRGECILAYWHHPRFSSGDHGNEPGVAPLWNALYAARADVVLNGHDHDYERFAQQDARGRPTSEGIREFVVGTGGRSHYTFSKGFDPTSEFHDQVDYGVLFLTLHPDGYDWQFRNVKGAVMDSGSSACHKGPPIAAARAPTLRWMIVGGGIAGILAVGAYLVLLRPKRSRRTGRHD
jgi:hypothetical protein